MSLNRLFIRVAVLGWTIVAFAIGPASGQEISESHLAAAVAVVNAAKATRGFDDLLPAVSQQVQNQLIRQRPDIHKQIVEVVDGEALKLVARRPELDTAIARLWARAFTEEELVSITAFYQSPAGQKFYEFGPKVISESLQAARSWSDRVREELLEKARTELKTQGVEF
jgi:uncharacterized protein